MAVIKIRYGGQIQSIDPDSYEYNPQNFGTARLNIKINSTSTAKLGLASCNTRGYNDPGLHIKYGTADAIIGKVSTGSFEHFLSHASLSSIYQYDVVYPAPDGSRYSVVSSSIDVDPNDNQAILAGHQYERILGWFRHNNTLVGKTADGQKYVVNTNMTYLDEEQCMIYPYLSNGAWVSSTWKASQHETRQEYYKAGDLYSSSECTDGNVFASFSQRIQVQHYNRSLTLTRSLPTLGNGKAFEFRLSSYISFTTSYDASRGWICNTSVASEYNSFTKAYTAQPATTSSTYLSAGVSQKTATVTRTYKSATQQGDVSQLITATGAATTGYEHPSDRNTYSERDLLKFNYTHSRQRTTSYKGSVYTVASATYTSYYSAKSSYTYSYAKQASHTYYASLDLWNITSYVNTMVDDARNCTVYFTRQNICY